MSEALFTIRILSSAVVFTRSQDGGLEVNPWCVAAGSFFFLARVRLHVFFWLFRFLSTRVNTCFFFSPRVLALLPYLNTHELHSLI
jgi:hypothetical protein